MTNDATENHDATRRDGSRLSEGLCRRRRSAPHPPLAPARRATHWTRCCAKRSNAAHLWSRPCTTWPPASGLCPTRRCCANWRNTWGCLTASRLAFKVSSHDRHRLGGSKLAGRTNKESLARAPADMGSRVDWKALSIDELREEKKKVLAWLDTANQDLAVARRKGAKGDFLPAASYDALINRRTKLVRTIRGLDMELQARREAREGRFNEAFYQAADELLDDTTFNKVHDRAEEILNG